MQRDLALLRDGRPFDLLVIGGGINGAGIARDARLRGLRTALIEKGDWASGTSSRSSRLVHGGLRYLEHGHLRLVREALHERATLLRLAPHLVVPVLFLAPAWGDSPRGIGMLSLGTLLYDLLAGQLRLSGRERLGAVDCAEREPALRRDRLQGGVLFPDARCDDARLVLATVRSAAAAGSVCASYVEAVRLVVEDGRVRGAELLDRLHGERFEVRATAVVNASGPWVGETGSLAGAGGRARVRLTRGAHLLVPRASRLPLLLPTSDGRVLFVLPAGSHSVLGTTDVDHEGGLDDVGATEADVRFLLAEAARALPRAALGRTDVRASWAALRPLAAGGGPPGSVSREHRIEVGPTGLVSVVGGKLTTYRALADAVVRRAAGSSGLTVGPSATGRTPLDGGDVEAAHGSRAGSASGTFDPEALMRSFATATARDALERHRLPLEHGARLAWTYGTRVSEVLDLLGREPALLARLCPSHPHLAVEAAYAVTAEMALTLADVLFRRTRVACGPCRGLDCAEATALAMAPFAGWSKTRVAEEVAAYAEEARRLTLPRAIA